MIFDCFTYFNELDLLKIRLDELSELDVTHVLIESDYTFSGNKKPLYFKEKKLAIKNKRIKNFVFDKMPNNGNPWDNESAQRNYIYNALIELNAKDDDIVILTDADEIVNPNSIFEYGDSKETKSLVMDLYFYYLNWQSGKQNWTLPKITTFGQLKKSTVTQIRNEGASESILNAGWHFSYIGGEEAVQYKIQSFSHQELNTPEQNTIEKIKERIEASNCLKLNTYESLPKYISENKKKIKHLIKNEKGWEKIFGWFDFQNIYDKFVDEASNGDVIVEIGAFMGKSTVYMAEKIKSSNKKINFYSIDSFVGEPTENTDNLYESYLSNLEINEVSHYVKTLKMTSQEALSKFKNKTIKFIFIDGSHKHEDVKADILGFLPKMKDESIMAGHDYHYVKMAVNEVFATGVKEDFASWIVENPKSKI
jgi:beta-1,4-mannosyl-glycoprotein beta-1,4-N-acetylglucosaminyltransferase